MSRSTSDELFDDEYGAISFSLNGGMLSLLLFALQIVAPYLVRFQPWRPQRIWLWPLVTPGVLFVLALLGLLAAWWGRRQSKKGVAARYGMLLNGAVFGILLLWALVIVLIVSVGRSTVFKPVSQPTRPQRPPQTSHLSTSELVEQHLRDATFGAPVFVDTAQPHHLSVIAET